MSNDSYSPPEFNPFSSPTVDTSKNIPVAKAHLAQYSTVRTGLKLIYYSIAVMAILAILMVLGAVSTGMFAAGSPGGGTSSKTIIFAGVLFLLGIAMLVAVITSLVGFCMCAACPNSNEKPYAITSILAFFVNLGVTFFDLLLVEEESMVTLIGVPVLGNVAGVVCTVAFCLLLKKIGTNISSEPLAKHSQSALVWFGLLMFAAFSGTLIIIAFADARGGADFSILAIPYGIAMLVLALGSFFQFLSMLRSGIDELNCNNA